MIRKYVVPILALLGMALAIYTVRAGEQQVRPAEPIAPPARAPFDSYVAGSGIVEASTQNIAIGTPVPGLVTRVEVKAGDLVKAGDPLFGLDDRALNAELLVRQSALDVASRNLARLLAQPRPEDIPPAEARVREAEAALEDLRRNVARWESVTDKRAVNEDDLARRRSAALAQEARLEQARAELAVHKAGAWAPDVEIARAQVAAAAAQVAATRTDLDRLTIRAPVDGQVLQLNVHAGEFAPSGVLATPLLLLGSVGTLHVRVDVDENDAWRIRADAPAQASLRGNSRLQTRLAFVRIEPYVVPKKSLTGESTERVDTRVLQVLYSFPHDALPVYVGQQMDVFIQAPPIGAPTGDKATGDKS